MIRIPAIAVLLTDLASAAAGPDQFSPEKVRSTRDFGDIRREVEALRGIKFVHEVPVYRISEQVLRAISDYELAKEFPKIKTDYANVDATCMWMVKNPEWFDVIVTDNMFGDIITDLGAMIQGGMGIAAGGSINPEGVSMFEPIGGSAPKYTGKNVINPLASIACGGMMLEHLGEIEAARAIENAIMYVTANKLKDMGAGRMGYSTTEVGDLVAERI